MVEVEKAENKIPKIIANHHIPFYQFQVKNLNLSEVNSSKRKFKDDKPKLTDSDVKLWSSDLRKELSIICKRHNYSGFILD